jgi:DNA-binding SARP family transcriptional activator
MLVARIASPLPDPRPPPQVRLGAAPGRLLLEVEVPAGSLRAGRLAADLAGLGYAVAWIRPMPYETDTGSIAALLLAALTAAHRDASGDHDPVVVVVESPTRPQSEAVLDQLLPPHGPEPIQSGVVLVVNSRQRYRSQPPNLARVSVKGPTRARDATVHRLLAGASERELAALGLAAQLGFTHPRFDALADAPAAPDHPWWVPLTGGWQQVDPAWRPALATATTVTPPLSRVACLGRLVADLAEAGAALEAIELCLQAGWPGLAADLLTGEAEALVSAGRHAALARWLKQLPAIETSSRPSLARAATALAPDQPVPVAGPTVSARTSRRRWFFRRSGPGASAPGTSAPVLTLAPVSAPPRPGRLSHPGPGDPAGAADWLDVRMIPVRIEARLLGPFGLSVAGQPAEQWRGNRGRLLLAYLLLNRDRPLGRDELGTAFWPDAAPGVVRNRLHVALYGLRQDLRRLTDHPIVVHGPGGFGLDAGISLWLDTEEFENALATGRGQRPGAPDQALGWYETALALYRGELLADAPFEEWAHVYREWLRLQYLETLDQVAQGRFAAGRYADCLDACQQLLPGELCREELHRLAMRCYTRLNQPHLAVRQYHQCERQLRDDLGLEPAEPTRQLYERIRRRELV